MRIAVTGTSGFLGSVVVPLLEHAGHEIVSINRKEGMDITDWQAVKMIKDFDVLIHLAAQSYVPDAYTDPHSFYNTNVSGTLNMLELARLNKARFIYISSYVYGHPQYLPIDELHPLEAVNPYGQSKLTGEDLCKAYYRDFKLDTTIFRPFNIYGAGQGIHFLIPKIISLVKADKVVELFDPRPKRDYVHVKDVAKAILLAVEKNATGFEVFNLGGGISYSPQEVITMLETMIGKKIAVSYLNKHRPNEIMDTLCNNAKAKKYLGWEPCMSFYTGLQEML